jgi:integrase
MARKAKPQRRKPGSGTIRYRKDRDLAFEASFPLGHGEHRTRSFAARSEAEAWLDALAADRDSRDPRDITGGSQPVHTLCARWLELRRDKIAPKTFEGYTYLLELALGEIGRYRVDEVTFEIADAMLMHFYRRGFQNIEQIKAVCLQAFEYAVDKTFIRSNPFAKVELPYVERRQGIALTEAQRQHLLDCAATEDRPDEPLCALWHLYARLGLRRGEGIGLRWQDCDLKDLDRATIMIRQQLVRVGRETVVRSTTKTKAARTIPVPRDIAELLISQKAEQVKRAATGGTFPHYVFTDSAGQPLTVDRVRWRLTLLKRRANVPADLRLHDLRHTALYLLELSGAPGSVLQALAGHRTAAMAAHYASHASVEDVRRALG